MGLFDKFKSKLKKQETKKEESEVAEPEVEEVLSEEEVIAENKNLLDRLLGKENLKITDFDKLTNFEDFETNRDWDKAGGIVVVRTADNGYLAVYKVINKKEVIKHTLQGQEEDLSNVDIEDEVDEFFGNDQIADEKQVLVRKMIEIEKSSVSPKPPIQKKDSKKIDFYDFGQIKPILQTLIPKLNKSNRIPTNHKMTKESKAVAFYIEGLKKFASKGICFVEKSGEVHYIKPNKSGLTHIIYDLEGKMMDIFTMIEAEDRVKELQNLLKQKTLIAVVYPKPEVESKQKNEKEKAAKLSVKDQKEIAKSLEEWDGVVKRSNKLVQKDCKTKLTQAMREFVQGVINIAEKNKNTLARDKYLEKITDVVGSIRFDVERIDRSLISNTEGEMKDRGLDLKDEIAYARYLNKCSTDVVRREAISMGFGKMLKLRENKSDLNYPQECEAIYQKAQEFIRKFGFEFSAEIGDKFDSKKHHKYSNSIVRTSNKELDNTIESILRPGIKSIGEEKYVPAVVSVYKYDDKYVDEPSNKATNQKKHIVVPKKANNQISRSKTAKNKVPNLSNKEQEKISRVLDGWSRETRIYTKIKDKEYKTELAQDLKRFVVDVFELADKRKQALAQVGALRKIEDAVYYCGHDLGDIDKFVEREAGALDNRGKVLEVSKRWLWKFFLPSGLREVAKLRENKTDPNYPKEYGVIYHKAQELIRKYGYEFSTEVGDRYDYKKHEYTGQSDFVETTEEKLHGTIESVKTPGLKAIGEEKYIQAWVGVYKYGNKLIK